MMLDEEQKEAFKISLQQQMNGEAASKETMLQARLNSVDLSLRLQKGTGSSWNFLTMKWTKMQFLEFLMGICRLLVGSIPPFPPIPVIFPRSLSATLT